MAYRDDIIALSPNHLWRFDGNALDSVGTLNGTETSTGVGPAIAEDSASSIRTTSVGGRIALPTAATVDQAITQKAIAGWIQLDRIQPPPKSIYREGAAGNQFCFVCWAGNNLMLDIVNSDVVTQLFSLRTLAPNRIFHLTALFSGSGFDDKIELYLDGVLQSTATPGVTTLNARDVGEWADPSGTTEVGNQVVLLNAPFNADYSYWASWSGNNAALTPTQIRAELFEKGALPGVTISSDTESNMQAALDSLSSTVRPDEPLNIKIEDVSGGGTLNLTADAITHSPLASIHVQFVGTGTLNYTNTNGSDASIGSTPNGGTLNFINPAILTVSPLELNSEVRVYESGTTTEIAGIENSGTSFVTSVSVNTVDVVVLAVEYEFVRVENVDMTQGDVSLPVSQVLDRQYENP